MNHVPASPTDVFSHHLARDSETRMTLVVRTSGELKGDTLLHSIATLLDAEPILGSALYHEADWLWWGHDPDVSADEVLTEHSDHDGDDERFCFGAFDLHKAPLWHVHLAHGSEDTLAVSMAHALGDGRALMWLVDRLLHVYAGGGPPVKHHGIPDRGLHQVMRRDVRETLRTEGPVSSWPSLYDGPGSGTGSMVTRTIGKDGFARIRQGWKRKASATVNDILLAAMALTLRDITGSGHDAVVSATVDNRQYAEGPVPEIANFSTNYAIRLGDIRGMGMEEAVSRVKTVMDDLKRSGDLGRDDLERFNELRTSQQVDDMVQTMYRSKEEGQALCFITNVGEISWSGSVTSSLDILDAYIAYPGISPPTLGLVCSSHRGSLNINLGVYEGLPRERAERLLDGMTGYLSSV